MEVGKMKDNIHPEYGDVTISCACGNVIKTKSTKKGNITVEICSCTEDDYQCDIGYHRNEPGDPCTPISNEQNITTNRNYESIPFK